MTLAVKSNTMQLLIKDAGDGLIPFRKGEVIEVAILSKSKKRIYVDVAGLTYGFIPEKEFSHDYQELKSGDKTIAYVLEEESPDGYVVLSLKKADRERFYKTLEERNKSGESLNVLATEANRGGLVVSYGPIEGFIPASQLAFGHYPRVGQNPEKILAHLKKLVGQTFKVKILSYDRIGPKIIFSEKALGDEILTEKVKQFKVGQIIEGTVTAVVDFGLFIDLGEIEGLVHISEVAWERIADLRKLYNPGDKVRVKVVSIENNRVALSIKQLAEDPWLKLTADLKIGNIIKGKVIKTTPFGAFVQIAPDLNGLLYHPQGPKDTGAEVMLEQDKTYKFEVKNIEPENHQIILTSPSGAKNKEKAAKK